MKKIFLIFSLVLFATSVPAQESNFIKTENGINKIDVRKIILSCRKEENFKKCLIKNILKAKKGISNLKNEERQEIAFNILETWNGYDLKSEKVANKINFLFQNNGKWLELGQSIEIFEKNSESNLEKAIYENILNANQKEKCNIKVSNFNSGTKA